MSLYHESASTRKTARVRRGFYIHSTVYVVVIALLVGINFATTPDRLWFQWPLLGWGFGVLAHAIAAFALAGRSASRA